MSSRRPVTFARFAYTLAGVALAFVLLLVLADPTPNFLGLGLGAECDGDEVLPVGSAPMSQDFSPPLVSKPSEKSAADASAVVQPVAIGLTANERSSAARDGFAPASPSAGDHARRSPQRC